MSKEFPVDFPVGQSAYDDLKQGLAQVRTVRAALFANEGGDLSADDIDAARDVLGEAIGYLEAAARWASHAHSEECRRDAEQAIGAPGTPPTTLLGRPQN
ncbi:hypothetical protein [Ancylobacter pratisalsi]|uniref:Uncharacterized protein n=1 Tax=Ancylobacter pratisalsi TaxID=1745854 RepID=A0A6P1YQZ2_9HYPH|nr:hypothetical protein [Ancylobacter pratisalsi]QIB35799.1 hypothetical protein G3A50_20355 [Ancylobacter pratisalsi]